MKKICLVILTILPTLNIIAQSGKDVNLNAKNTKIQFDFNTRKEKGFYNLMQVSLLFGNNQVTNRTFYYKQYYDLYSSLVSPGIGYDRSYAQTTLSVAPSLNISNGYIFNKHWAAGVGAGFEIFDHNLFPLFAELRYTLRDHTISPVVVFKGGYSLSNFKAIHYDELYLSWSPHYISDATLRNYGGLMFHPEIGVKIPLSNSDDLLFTAAYRYQKTKSVARKDYDNDQFDEWEHNVKRNRLSLGVAIMFR